MLFNVSFRQDLQDVRQFSSVHSPGSLPGFFTRTFRKLYAKAIKACKGRHETKTILEQLCKTYDKNHTNLHKSDATKSATYKQE